MSTSFEVDQVAYEGEFLGVDEVERNGVGAVYGLLSGQLEYVGVYGGLVNGAHRFSGIKIEERQQSRVATLKHGFDNHIYDDRTTHNYGAKPVIMLGCNPEIITASKRDFTCQLVALVADYLGQLQQNPDMPRRIDDEDLAAQLALFESINQGITDGSLIVDENGICNIITLLEDRS